MDNFLQLNDEKPKRQTRKAKVSINPTVTQERIQKLKKTFQPFWMRGMILHKKEEADQTSNKMNNFRQI